jgi:hypothetical protein
MNNSMDSWKKLTNPKAKLRALLNMKNYCDRQQMRMGDYARSEMIKLQKELES